MPGPHILLVTSVFPPAIGGPSLQTAEIADALVRVGWRASVLTYEFEGPSHEPGGVRVYRVDSGAGTAGRARRNLALLQAIDRVLAEASPDLVHVQVAEGNLPFLTGLAARRRRLPRLVKFSADLVWNRLNRDRYLGLEYEGIHQSSMRARALWAFQWATFRQYPLVWATSPFQRDALRSVYRLPDDRIHLLPNLVRIAAAPAPSPDRLDRAAGTSLVALTVCRVVPWKGIDDCIRSLAVPEAHGIRLRVVGSGDKRYMEELRRLATDQGVADRVELAGGVPPTLVDREYRTADLFVAPSLYEPFGIVLVQALAAGLPIVATGIGGIPDVVTDEETGLLVPARNPAALGRAMGRLAADPVLRARLGAQGRASCARFDLDARTEDLLAMYRRVLPRA